MKGSPSGRATWYCPVSGSLKIGLAGTPAATASLLLNLEGVFTSLLAWFVFRENFDRRIFAGMVCIVAGGILLNWQPGGLSVTRSVWLIVAACLCWALDNNFTQKVSGGDPLRITALKGLCAGGFNLGLSYFTLNLAWPGAGVLLGAAVVGVTGYGLSLAAFVAALRYLGTARTGAYFSLAPFVGATLSLLIYREAVTGRFLVAAACMAAGVYLHLTEKHDHEHEHEEVEHEHEHEHDEHHQHDHSPPVSGSHCHRHKHKRLKHKHQHYPDLHHRHDH